MGANNLVRKARHLGRKMLAPGRKSAAGGRTDCTNITRIFRNPPQLRLLAGLLREAGHDPLQVVIYGVADGAEAVSLLIALDPARTGIAVTIAGFDIAQEYLAYGRQFLFTPRHFVDTITPAECAPYLVPAERGWRLAPGWQKRIHFAYGNVLEPGPAALQRGCDLVMCQNTLIHLPVETLSTAVANLAALVRPGGLLAAGGGPLDRVPALILAQGFQPIAEDAAAIHESWTVQRHFYDNQNARPYWALEPFDADHPQGVTRYFTLFRKPEAPVGS